MKITSLILSKFKYQPPNLRVDNTCSLQADEAMGDTFIKSTNQCANSDGYTLDSIKSISPNTTNILINTEIVRDVNNFEKFFLVKNKEVLCWIQMSDNGEAIQIDRLYSINPQSHIGAGTELLKYAVTKSIEQGYGGRINLCMADSQPFYRKCNFKLGKLPSEYDPALDAIFDFSARTKGKYPMGWSKRQKMFAFLDEEGAEAFLKDKRIFPRPDSKIMNEVTFVLNQNNKNAKINGFIDFCDVGDNKYVVQFLKVDKTEQTVYQSAYILAELVEVEGAPCLKVVEAKTFPLGFYNKDYEDKFNIDVYNALMDALKTRASELGFEVIE